MQVNPRPDEQVLNLQLSCYYEPSDVLKYLYSTCIRHVAVLTKKKSISARKSLIQECLCSINSGDPVHMLQVSSKFIWSILLDVIVLHPHSRTILNAQPRVPVEASLAA